MKDSFNKLESKILEWFKNTCTDRLLDAQLASVEFLKRDWTGHGFYVVLEVPSGLEPTSTNQWPINGPSIISDDIQDGGGTLLWGKDGYINCIEMFSYGEFFNEEVNSFELST